MAEPRARWAVPSPETEPLHWIARAEQLWVFRRYLAAAALVLLCAAPALAQAPSPQQPVMLVWEPPMDPATGLGDYVGWYRVAIGNAPGQTTGAQRVDDGRSYAFLPPDRSKPYYLRVSNCWLARVDGKDVETCGPDSNEVVIPAAVPDVCAPPLGSEAASVIVTRWEATTGLPNSRMRVNYQLGGKSPITEIVVKVDGQPVAQVTGENLTDSAGTWFTAPSAGRHKLAVMVTNGCGCSREAASFSDVVIR